MSGPRKNPRNMALAYRIWADCQTHGWYRTIAEVADALNEPPNKIQGIVHHRGWASRFKSVSHRHIDSNFNYAGLTDRALEAMS